MTRLLSSLVLVLLLTASTVFGQAPCTESPSGQSNCDVQNSPDRNGDGIRNGLTVIENDDGGVSAPTQCTESESGVTGKSCCEFGDRLTTTGSVEWGWTCGASDFFPIRPPYVVTRATDGTIESMELQNSDGATTYAWVWPNAAKTDEGDAGTAGTFAWVLSRMTTGASIFPQGGTFTIGTTVNVTKSGITIQCASHGKSDSAEGTQFRAKNSLNADVLHIGEQSTVMQGGAVIGCTFNGNSANNSSGDLIELNTTANYVVERNRFVGRAGSAIHLRATSVCGSNSTCIFNNIGPNNNCVANSGTGPCLLWDGESGYDATDTHIFGNNMGGTASANPVLDMPSAKGIKLVDNHIYGGGSSQADCIYIHPGSSTILLGHIDSNVIEHCGVHGIHLVNASHGDITGNLSYNVSTYADSSGDVIYADASNAWTVTGYKMYSSTTASSHAGVTRHGINLNTGSNWNISGIQATDLTGYGVLDNAGGGTTTVGGVRYTGSGSGRVSLLASDTDLQQQLPWCHTFSSPAGTENRLVWRAEKAGTVTAIDCISNAAASSVLMTLNKCDTNGANCSAIEAQMTCASTNTSESGSIDSPALTAGQWVRIALGTVTGTPGHLTICVTVIPN